MSLATFLQEYREQILQVWIAKVSAFPAAQGKSWGVLRDHIPQMIDEIARSLDGDAVPPTAIEALAGRHASLRFRNGYDPRQVVAEYQALRHVCLSMYDATLGDAPRERIRPVLLFNEMIDVAIADAVDRFVDERDRAREIFVGILGHDLRTPLQAIAMGTQILLTRGEELDDRTIKLAVRMATAAGRMDKMIRDLLDFTRGRLGGGIPIERTRTDLGAIAAHVVDELTTAYRDRVIELARMGDDLIGAWDGDRVAQAISNLVCNAVEHGRDPVRVTLRANDGDVEVVVENRGEIDEARRVRLFEPFVHDPGEPRGDGLGLGLYIVREIARAHGGRIEVESRDGRTRFVLALPRSLE